MAATAEGSSTTTVPEPPIQLDHLQKVDLRGMSRAGLYSLLKCTPSGFDPVLCDDMVISKIDGSVVIESNLEQLVPIRVEYSPTEPLVVELSGTSAPIAV